MARHRLRELNRLDIEMNEVLTKSLKESDRQEKIMVDIVGLLDENQEIFGEGSTAFEKSKRAEGNVLTWQAGVPKKVETTDATVQVDEKEEYGVVTNLAEEEEPEPPVEYDPTVYQRPHPDDRGGGHGKPRKSKGGGMTKTKDNKEKEKDDGTHRCANCDAPGATMKCRASAGRKPHKTAGCRGSAWVGIAPTDGVRSALPAALTGAAATYAARLCWPGYWRRLGRLAA